jgi:hypothetical protein
VWSDAFLDSLQGDFAPIFLLESVQVGDFSGGRDLRISSHYVSGYEEAIDPPRCSISHGELQVPSWTRTGTAVTIASTKDLRRQVRPGQVVRLRIGFRSWSPGEYETVFLGAVRGLRWSAGRWSLSLVDLAYSLQSRFVSQTADPRLFASLDESATVSSAYTASDTTINVDSTAGFVLPDSDPFLLLVTPDGGEDPFFVTATAKTGTTFTGCSPGQLGTTAVSCGTSTTITPCAYTETHPLNAVRRILVSTGTAGANGSRDVLPASWGYGLPAELVDGEDIVSHVLASSPATGANDWVFLATEPADDGQSAIGEFLRPGGFFLGEHQGRITARAVIDPSTVTPPHSWNLRDGTVESYDAWDPAVIESRTIQMAMAGGGTWGTSATEQLDTRPCREKLVIDQPSIYTNETAWGSSIDDRLRPYLLRRGERLTMRSAGLRLAPAAIGDCLRLTTDQVTSRYDVEGNGFNERRTLIIGGGPDWFRGECRFTILSTVPGALVTQ